jgi:hypothetical protein
MKHHYCISILVIIIFLIVIYKLSTFQLKTIDNVMMFYFVLLELVIISFEHLYESDFGFSACDDE